MKNIIYYLKKYGQYTFEERPFSEVDSFVLSAVSYLMFELVLPSLDSKKPPVVVSSLRSEFVLNRLVVNTMDERLNRKLWRLLIKSPRFCKMKIGYCREVMDEHAIEQFAAITCFLPDGRLHVCFRGTDLTLLGWKENFKMSYLDEIPAQADAVAYLNEVASRTEGEIYVGGHSKGGNLAVYAAMRCDASARSRIVGVFNQDGPGFRTDIFQTEEYAAIADRVRKVIPCDDLVGMLLFHEQKVKIVKCRGLFLLQHDPYNWAIGRDGAFKSVSRKSAGSDVIDVTVKAWLDSMEEKRPHFVDLLFYVLGADDGVTVADYRARPVEEMRAVKERFRSLEEEERKFFRHTVKEFWRYGKENIRKLKKRKPKPAPPEESTDFRERRL